MSNHFKSSNLGLIENGSISLRGNETSKDAFHGSMKLHRVTNDLKKSRVIFRMHANALNLSLQTPVPLTYPVFDTRRTISLRSLVTFRSVPYKRNNVESFQRDDKLVFNCFAIHLSVRCYH